MGRRYLIVKTSSLGDIVHTIPVVSYLKMVDPDCTIDWIAEKAGAQLLKAVPLLDRVLVIDTKKWRSQVFATSTRNEVRELFYELRKYTYDMVFDLQGNVKSGLLTFLTKAGIKGGFGKQSVPEWPNLLFTHKKVNPPDGQNIAEDYLSVASGILGVKLPEKIAPVAFKVDLRETTQVEEIVKGCENPVLLAPGSAWENKRMSLPQLVSVLKKRLEKETCKIFLLWGSESEFQVCNLLVKQFSNAIILPKLSLAAVQLLKSKMSLVISMDSLPLHLAATAGVATLSFFGPSSGAKYAPKGKLHRFIQGGCPYGETFVKRCSKLRTCPTGACIKNINLELK